MGAFYSPSHFGLECPGQSATGPNLAAQRDYERGERSPQTRQVWESFLAVHSDGFYADLARARLSKLIATEIATEAVPNAASLDFHAPELA